LRFEHIEHANADGTNAEQFNLSVSGEEVYSDRCHGFCMVLRTKELGGPANVVGTAF
jgi:hypothetical protein